MGKACVVILCAAATGALCLGQATSTGRRPASRPTSDLEYWLDQAQPASAPASAPAGSSPLGPADRFSREDALPGVVVLSDGRVLPGEVFTTRDHDWEVWVESENRWRHVPPAAVLGIRAVVVEEGMELEWRWKEMGSDEKVFTGRSRPIRRLRWRFHLADGSDLTGDVKGQPIWIEHAGRRLGPFVLHERSAGDYGQNLQQLVYVRRVVFSLRAMRQAIQAQAGASTAPS